VPGAHLPGTGRLPGSTVMILIVSYPQNEHVDEVLKHVTRDTVVIDTASFPVSLGLSVAMNGEREDLQLALPAGRRIRLCNVGAIWYRRISPYGFHEDLRNETARLFAWSEANEALLGVWYSLGAYWMNSPLADEVSQRKVRQLQVARQVGLTIPDTLVTNEPDVAQMFVQQHGIGRVVRKAFRNIAQAPRETHLLRAEDLALLDSVCYTPVIFQEFVPATLDLRVTVVEDDIFAAAVTSESQYAADYRPGLASATVVPYELPHDVAGKLHALMKVFGLNYGAIDLRLTPDGDYVFLEVNPAGEYLFISARTGQPISQAIAAALERHDAARHAKQPC
jgi:glutathione synthase/RimK-type ligase-like ATP-grasp enzyme